MKYYTDVVMPRSEWEGIVRARTTVGGPQWEGHRARDTGICYLNRTFDAYNILQANLRPKQGPTRFEKKLVPFITAICTREV